MPNSQIAAERKRIEALLGEGRFDAALPICEALVQHSPVEAEAWFWLGYVQLLRGDLARAEAALIEAIRLDPNSALYWTNLSIVALGLGRAVEAESHARQAIDLEDASDTVWINLGSALFQQQRFADAAGAYRQAVSRQPQNAAAWSNVATAELRRGQLEAAQEAYERSLTIAPNPQLAILYSHLLMRRGNPQQAIHILRQIIDQVPTLVAAWLAWGDCQGLVGNVPQAEAAYRKALEVEPNSREARRNLALNLLMQFRFSEAEQHVRQLTDTAPGDAEAWALVAAIQQGQGRTADALDSLRRSIALAPDANRHSRLLVAMQYLEGIDAQALLAEHRAWNDAHAQPSSPACPGGAHERVSGKRLRIGLTSANFGRHPIAFLALPALEHLDRSRCSVVCYSDRLDEDDFTARFRAASDLWRPTIGMSENELAEQVRRDEIDVLIDLMGHTGPRMLIFAARPAPVQVTWLGYVGTTGLAAMDFLLADRFHVQPGEEAWYCETVLRLPDSYACFGAPEYCPEVNGLPAATTGHVTFGSFNNPAKFTSGLLEAWATILQRAPGAQLLLKFGGLDEPQVQHPIRERFTRRGIAPERIVMEGRAPHAEFLAAYHRVDLALDTQPYSGGLTTCEALWMGVPVVTFPGRTFAGRHSTSYLSTAGLTDFIAADLEGYIDLALNWASRQEELAALRRALRGRLQPSPLCDAKRFAEDWLSLLVRAYDMRTAREK